MIPEKKSLILIGGGGHGKSCIDVIEAQGLYKIAGIVDTKERLGQRVAGYKVIATDEDLESLAGQYEYFLVTIGSIKDPGKRVEKFDTLKRLGASFPVIISPLAHVAKGASVQEGTIVMHNALVNTDARIGRNCIINTCALIEHDALIGDHTHISTGSVINGACRIGERVFTGSNSVVVHEMVVCSDTVIGAGAVITRPITEAGVYIGNPACRRESEVKL